MHYPIDPHSKTLSWHSSLQGGRRSGAAIVENSWIQWEFSALLKDSLVEQGLADT